MIDEGSDRTRVRPAPRTLDAVKRGAEWEPAVGPCAEGVRSPTT